MNRETDSGHRKLQNDSCTFQYFSKWKKIGFTMPIGAYWRAIVRFLTSHLANQLCSLLSTRIHAHTLGLCKMLQVSQFTMLSRRNERSCKILHGLVYAPLIAKCSGSLRVLSGPTTPSRWALPQRRCNCSTRSKQEEGSRCDARRINYRTLPYIETFRIP